MKLVNNMMKKILNIYLRLIKRKELKKRKEEKSLWILLEKDKVNIIKLLKKKKMKKKKIENEFWIEEILKSEEVIQSSGDF